ncbi:M14 family metallocarboxypeptidase [Oscillatoria laete-virens NRMC-F 0139]|nr:M14 family metallocarboxypeptidase [Oscillatoria laete-virens]MDL5053643.1 M14 family metallocarboxypeptidase [Oscillatoria laete-virens NRMC-F 0139]
MPPSRKIRSFKDLETRIRGLASDPAWCVTELGKVSGYPFYQMNNLHAASSAHWSVHLSGGVHGDEPAGVLGLMGFLEQMSPAWRKKVALSVFPCVNPWGYERNLRENKQGQDINRMFKRGANCVEVRLMTRAWRGRTFDFVATCHEDYDAPGAYVYELKSQPPFWGREILRAFSRHVSIDPRPVIEGQPANQGLIRRDLGKLPRGLHPEAIYLVKGARPHTGHTLTFETPSLQPLENRVAAQIAALRRCFTLMMRASKL